MEIGIKIGMAIVGIIFFLIMNYDKKKETETN